MQDQIVCPNCKKTIPLTEAISHEIEEKYKKRAEEYQQKVQYVFKKQLEEERKKHEEEKVQLGKALEDKLRERLKNQMRLELQDKQNEAAELKEQNEKLRQQMLETNKLVRQIKEENEQKELEREKELLEERERIRQKATERAQEEYRLKILEKEKKLQEAIQVNEELKRKLEQGSQQTQGEVMELELERQLGHAFPADDILPVPKGIKGADLMQIVKNTAGKPCGTILWETKRTKAWSNEWVQKLKDDQRSVRAELSVIITQVLPPDIKYFGEVEGIWVGEFGCVMGLAHALRSRLLEVTMLKLSSVGKNEKMEVLYNYLSGTEFKQRVEAIVETFRAMQEDVKKERAWFMAKWSRTEKNLMKVIDNTFGMHGDLQSIMGKELDLLPAADLPYNINSNEQDDTEKGDDERLF